MSLDSDSGKNADEDDDELEIISVTTLDKITTQRFHSRSRKKLKARYKFGSIGKEINLIDDDLNNDTMSDHITSQSSNHSKSIDRIKSQQSQSDPLEASSQSHKSFAVKTVQVKSQVDEISTQAQSQAPSQIHPQGTTSTTVANQASKSKIIDRSNFPVVFCSLLVRRNHCVEYCHKKCHGNYELMKHHIDSEIHKQTLYFVCYFCKSSETASLQRDQYEKHMLEIHKIAEDSIEHSSFPSTHMIQQINQIISPTNENSKSEKDDKPIEITNPISSHSENILSCTQPTPQILSQNISPPATSTDTNIAPEPPENNDIHISPEPNTTSAQNAPTQNSPELSQSPSSNADSPSETAPIPKEYESEVELDDFTQAQSQVLRRGVYNADVELQGSSGFKSSLDKSSASADKSSADISSVEKSTIRESISQEDSAYILDDSDSLQRVLQRQQEIDDMDEEYQDDVDSDYDVSDERIGRRKSSSSLQSMTPVPGVYSKSQKSSAICRSERAQGFSLLISDSGEDDELVDNERKLDSEAVSEYKSPKEIATDNLSEVADTNDKKSKDEDEEEEKEKRNLSPRRTIPDSEEDIIVERPKKKYSLPTGIIVDSDSYSDLNTENPDRDISDEENRVIARHRKRFSLLPSMIEDDSESDIPMLDADEQEKEIDEDIDIGVNENMSSEKENDKGDNNDVTITKPNPIRSENVDTDTDTNGNKLSSDTQGTQYFNARENFEKVQDTEPQGKTDENLQEKNTEIEGEEREQEAREKKEQKEKDLEENIEEQIEVMSNIQITDGLKSDNDNALKEIGSSKKHGSQASETLSNGHKDDADTNLKNVAEVNHHIPINISRSQFSDCCFAKVSEIENSDISYELISVKQNQASNHSKGSKLSQVYQRQDDNEELSNVAENQASNPGIKSSQTFRTEIYTSIPGFVSKFNKDGKKCAGANEFPDIEKAIFDKDQVCYKSEPVRFPDIEKIEKNDCSTSKTVLDVNKILPKGTEISVEVCSNKVSSPCSKRLANVIETESQNNGTDEIEEENVSDASLQIKSIEITKQEIMRVNPDTVDVKSTLPIKGKFRERIQSSTGENIVVQPDVSAKENEQAIVNEDYLAEDDHNAKEISPIEQDIHTKDVHGHVEKEDSPVEKNNHNKGDHVEQEVNLAEQDIHIENEVGPTETAPEREADIEDTDVLQSDFHMGDNADDWGEYDDENHNDHGNLNAAEQMNTPPPAPVSFFAPGETSSQFRRLFHDTFFVSNGDVPSEPDIDESGKDGDSKICDNIEVFKETIALPGVSSSATKRSIFMLGNNAVENAEITEKNTTNLVDSGDNNLDDDPNASISKKINIFRLIEGIWPINAEIHSSPTKPPNNTTTDSQQGYDKPLAKNPFYRPDKLNLEFLLHKSSAAEKIDDVHDNQDNDMENSPSSIRNTNANNEFPIAERENNIVGQDRVSSSLDARSRHVNILNSSPVSYGDKRQKVLSPALEYHEVDSSSDEPKKQASKDVSVYKTPSRAHENMRSILCDNSGKKTSALQKNIQGSTFGDSSATKIDYVEEGVSNNRKRNITSISSSDSINVDNSAIAGSRTPSTIPTGRSRNVSTAAGHQQSVPATEYESARRERQAKSLKEDIQKRYEQAQIRRRDNSNKRPKVLPMSSLMNLFRKRKKSGNSNSPVN